MQQIIYTKSNTVDLIPVWPSILLDIIANLSFIEFSGVTAVRENNCLTMKFTMHPPLPLTLDVLQLQALST